MIKAGYPVNRLSHIGYKGITHQYPVNQEKFTLKIAQNETASTNVSDNIEDIISELENGNKDAINFLENLSLNYSLTEYKDGYKIKFEQNGNTYTVAYNGEIIKNDNQTPKTEEVDPNDTVSEDDTKSLLDSITPPQPPQRITYLKEVTYSNGMKEALLDDSAYEKAMQDYFVQKVEYENKINEINMQTAEKQKQDIISNAQNELDSFSQNVKELQAELDKNGTNSKIITSVIKELSSEYEELLQKKKDLQIKNIERFIQNDSIPNPPSLTFYETDEEYTKAFNYYNYQKFLYEKQQKEFEIRENFSAKRIEKIDEKLEKIRQMLFGTEV